MNDLIEKLSNLRSQYNCFDENERDAYNTLSEAIKVLSERTEIICGVVDSIKPFLEKVPSVQPEVIRCKDCKWKNGHNCTRAVELFIDDDKYCAWAERR